MMSYYNKYKIKKEGKHNNKRIYNIQDHRANLQNQSISINKLDLYRSTLINNLHNIGCHINRNRLKWWSSRLNSHVKVMINKCHNKCNNIMFKSNNKLKRLTNLINSQVIIYRLKKFSKWILLVINVVMINHK